MRGKLFHYPNFSVHSAVNQFVFAMWNNFTNNKRMGNSFGTLFRISSWGESHGGGIGVVIDGCPPRLDLSEEDIQPCLERRRPGQSKLTTPRDEADQVEILSGTFEGKTLGTPIALLVRNKDARPQAYDEMKSKFRPSHADFTYQNKFGIRNHERSFATQYPQLSGSRQGYKFLFSI